MKNDNTTNLIDKNFDEILAEGFNRYAKYIIQDRALPELRDGLKPVQRRILYAMYKLNLFHDSQFKKSARTVGDVLGKYHPHGDSSIYEALIRMGQDWKNNIAEIEIHGNKGSIDDDPAAAMRYTEARLSLYGEELLNHIEKKIYPFINNFDDTETEPTILPSLLPNLLINGASGIAAGYATSIPTFNATELLNVIINKIKKPNLSLQEILKIMPGPDFPTAGNLFNQGEIKKIYLNGEGKITIRSSYHVLKGNKKEKTKIIITDIPYETIKSDIVAQIETLIADNKLPGINNVIDATDKNGIAIELEADDNEIDVTSIMQFLYKKTQLQVNFNANMVAIYNKKPVKIGILKYLDFYIEAAIEIIIKVEKYLLKQDEERYEIVLGLIKAISILDDVIACIRASKDKQDSINNLVKKFYFTSKQAEAIVNLKLYRLTNTDMKLLQEEKEDLNKKIANHYLILKNKNEQENVLITQLKQYIKTFGYARKSKIADDETLEKNEISIKDLLNEKPVYIVITNNNQIKYVSRLESDWSKFNLINYKTENDYIKFIIPSNVKNKLVFFTNQGRMVGMDVFKLQEAKWKDNGQDLLIKLHLPTNEVIISCLNLEDILASNTKNLLFYTKMGKAKQIDKTELTNKKDIRLANCINLDDTDELCGVKIINNNDEEVLAFSKNGYALRFSLTAIPIVSLKAKGINIIKLNKNDELKEVVSLNTENEIRFVLFLNNYVKTLNPNEIETSKRNLVGKHLFDNKKNENILMIFKKDKDNLYYAYDKLFNFVFLGNLSIENTINWNKLDKTLNFVNVIKEE